MFQTRNLQTRRLRTSTRSICLNKSKIYQKRYKIYLGKWRLYCNSRKVDPVDPRLGEGLDFLAQFYDEGRQYSAINTARSALSTIVNFNGQISFGKYPLVCRFLKGIFELRPALPRYVDTWDVGVVLQYLKHLSKLESISLKQLTYKLNMMLMLLSGQRTQTLTLLDINHINITDNCCIFHVKECVKQTRPVTRQSTIEIAKYPQDTNLCIKSVLIKCLEKTKDKRGTKTRLLISFVKAL